MRNKGTFPMFKMHNVGTPKMYDVWSGINCMATECTVEKVPFAKLVISTQISKGIWVSFLLIFACRVQFSAPLLSQIKPFFMQIKGRNQRICPKKWKNPIIFTQWSQICHYRKYESAFIYDIVFISEVVFIFEIILKAVWEPLKGL